MRGRSGNEKPQQLSLMNIEIVVEIVVSKFEKDTIVSCSSMAGVAVLSFSLSLSLVCNFKATSSFATAPCTL